MTDLELFNEINKLIETDIKFLINADGGKIRLVSVVDKVAKVEMFGACTHCPAIKYTMSLVVEPMIMDKFPEIESVTLS